MDIKLSYEEVCDLTGYEQACKQLEVLKKRGFFRAYIARKGGVVLERTHYESVTRGQDDKPVKSANINFMRRAA